MPKKIYKAKEIINVMRQIEILVSRGQTAQTAARGVGMSEQTYYRWRKEYEGMRIDHVRSQSGETFVAKTYSYSYCSRI